MMSRTGLLQWCLIGAALSACADSGNGGMNEAATLDAEQATLIAALAANEDGSDEAWTSASGTEPFIVEGCGFDVIAERVMERFDTNSDGVLSADELSALSDELGDPFERLELLMSLYDADASGDLEAGERETLQADLEARCEVRRERLLERFDADGDGTLSEDEREAARDALRERFSRRHAARVDEFDRNEDGLLGPLERRSAGASIRRRVADRRAAISDEFDTDGNGELDASEREALEEHLRACVRGERPLAPVDETPAADAGAP
jgi:Ca2+-binding EF-hand superfamily protein